MPANLSPEYKAAREAFRRAREPRERLDRLREMLRAIPKHKGTEHLQADIKTRIRELTEELAGPQKTGARGGPPTIVPHGGAAQVALLGPPNSGKSTLHVRLTGSHSPCGPYPFTTQFPSPGMLPYEDINIQLVDLPPISPQHPVPWIANALQPADAAMLVVDLSEPECVEQVMSLHDLLRERRVVLGSPWPADAETVEDDELDPFTIRLPVVLTATKADLIPDLASELAVFEELTGLDYPCLATSAVTGEGLDEIGPWLFRNLAIVRVYTKAPNRPPDLDRPFTVIRGGTVHDVAVQVHRELASSLRYARLWGSESFDGQQVGAAHVVADGDVLELHD